MAEHTNRTFICSVLFLDIVEYSQRSVAEQIALKERFNAVLTEAIAGVATDDRIILDTGDGAAVSFLGDPEDTLFAGMSLRDAVAGQDVTSGPQLQIRVGVNLGPVRLVKDINGQPNIIGDGINVAQRVMSFAEPGQILVSRSYYDVMARLSEDYAKLFHYEGAKTDKHVREHEVYAISAAPSNLRRTVPVRAPKPTLRIPSLHIPKFLKLRPRTWPDTLAVNGKLLVAAPLAFTLIVGTGVIAQPPELRRRGENRGIGGATVGSAQRRADRGRGAGIRACAGGRAESAAASRGADCTAQGAGRSLDPQSPCAAANGESERDRRSAHGEGNSVGAGAERSGGC